MMALDIQIAIIGWTITSWQVPEYKRRTSGSGKPQRLPKAGWSHWFK